MDVVVRFHTNTLEKKFTPTSHGSPGDGGTYGGRWLH